MARSGIDTARRRALRRRENELRRAGYARVAGADEAGVGPLAGPLVAAAVVLPARARLPGVDDSKRLRPEARETWAVQIESVAIAWSVEAIEPQRVDEIGPYRASIEALAGSLRRLDPAADYVLVDARPLAGLEVPHESVIGGDRKHLCIAAASILAKVARDRLMRELDAEFPEYGFARHKGYGTEAHVAALKRHGPCSAHRQSYAPVREAAGAEPRLF